LRARRDHCLPEVALTACIALTLTLQVRKSAQLLLAASLLVGCGAPDQPSTTPASAVLNEAERYGGTGVVGVRNVNAPLHPLAARYLARAVTRDLLFLPLIRYDSRGEPVPTLAEHWEATSAMAGYLNLTFYLRPDVRWHDGELTTADDVVFTFSRVLDPRYGHPSRGPFSDHHGEPERVNQHAVRFRVRNHPDFLKAFADVPIAPHHLLHHEPPSELAISGFARQPIGNGPFRFLRHIHSHELVLEANPDFPEGLGGRPYLDRLIFREGTNPYAIRANLLTGRFHIGQMLRDQVEFSDPPPGFRFVTDPETEARWIVWDDDSAWPPATASRTLAGSRLRGVEPDGVSIFGGAARWWLTPRQAHSP
jgi:peptide/nickel transport system substrate-binding protein